MGQRPSAAWSAMTLALTLGHWLPLFFVPYALCQQLAIVESFMSWEVKKKEQCAKTAGGTRWFSTGSQKNDRIMENSQKDIKASATALN